MSAIELHARHRRYIDNPCESMPEKLANIVDSSWLKAQIKDLTHTLTARPISTEECEEGGPYTGIGGVGYAILRASSLTDASKDYFVKVCDRLLTQQLVHAKKASPGRLSRYLTGTLGLYTIQALLLHYDGQSMDTVKTIFQSLLTTVITPGYQRIGDDELMNGRAGFLASALLLKMETGEDVLTDYEIRSVLNAIFASGRNYSRDNSSDARLMFQWHGSEYLSAAHGVSGIYQVLLSYWRLLTATDRADLLQSVDWYLTLQSAEGNFPSSSRHIGEDRGDNELVHWCHGATGAIQMLITAHIITGQTKYLESAKLCANVIWKKGLLRKGPGICHGVAGSGYALLLLHRHTSQPEYLAKAKAFAVVMMEPNFAKLARTPDAPYSLFEGWAGVLCFLSDLLDPQNAQFPLVPIIFPGSFNKVCQR